MQTVKSKDGQILTESEEVKDRWKESFQELYNKKNPTDEELTQSVPQMPSCKIEPAILREEIESAVKKMSDGKAPGYDNITAEELKAAGSAGIEILHMLCTKIWDSEIFPDDWGGYHHTNLQEERQA
ncbi:uncharacterized protein [Amphiura filiformis]|uniref:uncharacterized protein n=1 Tax=Amphiura filiformis TaxID=82378 RepID=UPI003B217B72